MKFDVDEIKTWTERLQEARAQGFRKEDFLKKYNLKDHNWLVLRRQMPIELKNVFHIGGRALTTKRGPYKISETYKAQITKHKPKVEYQALPIPQEEPKCSQNPMIYLLLCSESKEKLFKILENL